MTIPAAVWLLMDGERYPDSVEPLQKTHDKMGVLLMYIEWLPGWQATRLHAFYQKSNIAFCGFHKPDRLPDADWFRLRLERGVPHCKKCERELEKMLYRRGVLGGGIGGNDRDGR